MAERTDTKRKTTITRKNNQSVIKQATLSNDKKKLIVGTKPTDYWNTPSWLFEHFRKHFDPCPPKPLADGRLIKWKSPAFVNPPYSDIETWVDKALLEQRRGVDVVMLIRTDPSTKWYKKLMESNAHIAFFNERLYFNDGKGRSNFCSMLVYLEGYNVRK